MRFSDDDIRKELNDRLKSASVRVVAAALGVSPTMVSQVANGKFPPGPKLAEALGYADDGLRWVKRAKRK